MTNAVKWGKMTPKGGKPQYQMEVYIMEKANTNEQTKEKMEVATFSVKGLAEYLGISYGLANELTWREGFPVVQLGRKKIIPKVALDAWLMEQKRVY